MPLFSLLRSHFPPSQTIAIAAVSSAFTVVLLHTIRTWPSHDASPEPQRPRRKRQSDGTHDQSLIEEQLTRNAAFLGPEGHLHVQNAFVIIIGLGGVGSAAATALARSGVGRIRLIDFDQVTLSSLNVSQAI